MGQVKKIKKCRISGSPKLKEIINLGQMALTGVFPLDKNAHLTKGPISLVWCEDSGLVQLANSYDLNEMYGRNYGYRSSLNKSMIQHLEDKVNYLFNLIKFEKNDMVVDIGSNDGTLLNKISFSNLTKVGIDPSAEKFIDYYNDDIDLLIDFFPSEKFRKKYKFQKAKLITSIAMFYDLESPSEFVKNIYNILDVNGIWHFEQSYLLSMLKNNSYDTICHEHLEYYSLNVINNLLIKNNLKIIDVHFNEINGGSFAISAARVDNKIYKPDNDKIEGIIDNEIKYGLNTLKPYENFYERVKKHKKDLKDLLYSLKKNNKKVFGYGASTKGNVLLQYCDITADLIPLIAEVNKDKFGCFTPGSNIPIISESDAKAMKPDYFLVLPWHFKDHILHKEKEFLAKGGKFIFPLPNICVV